MAAGLAAALLAASAAWAESEALPPLRYAVAEYGRLAAGGECGVSPPLTIAVDLAAGDGLEASYDAASGRLRLLYRMSFNQVTEGWNWHPEADLDKEDYYRYKYLPLASAVEDRGGYRSEDKIGTPQETRILWRYDYFFAFDNLYDFYPRVRGDDDGFAAELTLPAAEGQRLAAGGIAMALTARLGPPCAADSTTFWKAHYGKPVDFTLKKRYLLGRLEAVWFYDRTSRRVLARLQPGAVTPR